MGCIACSELKEERNNKIIRKNNEKVDITGITNEDYKNKEDNENHENKNGLNINIDKNKIDNLKIEGDIVNEGTNSKISLKLMNGYENTNELVPSQSINQTSTLIAGSGTNTKVLSNYCNINNFQPKNSENPHIGNDIDGIINE